MGGGYRNCHVRFARGSSWVLSVPSPYLHAFMTSLLTTRSDLDPIVVSGHVDDEIEGGRKMVQIPVDGQFLWLPEFREDREELRLRLPDFLPETMAAAARVLTAVGALQGSRAGKCGFLLQRQPFSLRPGALRLRSRALSKGCRALYKPDVEVKEEGQPETLDYRVFFLDGSGKKISPWHDIPLHLGDGTFNFIVEIPKESSAKMEVATDEPFTPIKQDTKKGKLRYYPYNINWNYGLLPQTWEDPSFSNEEVDGAFGDNDPVDVVEIGDAQGKIGQILRVKPLAALAMIDEGELDWKIVAISLDDPRASLVNDVDDVEKHFPGTLTAIRDWFRDYKIPDGKPPNNFGLGNKPANKEYALKVIAETNESWSKLVRRSVPAGELSLA